jgi:endonuclease III
MAPQSLAGVVRRLRESGGAPETFPTSDPFELVLLENVAYLADPSTRREAFDELRRSVGTRPAEILDASRSSLEKATRRGIFGARFASRLQDCARIAIEKFGGDLDAAISGPVDRAKKALRAFPGIGEPGAEKVLLFCGRALFLAPDSNALRVLARLGFAEEQSSYAKTYASSRAAAASLPAKAEAYQEAHLLLQRHGRTLCRRSVPHCDQCPLVRDCDYARGVAGAAAPRIGSGRSRGSS